jgi:hypothetical protein
MRVFTPPQRNFAVSSSSVSHDIDLTKRESMSGLKTVVLGARVFSLAFIYFAVVAAASSVEERLDQINRLPQKECAGGLCLFRAVCTGEDAHDDFDFIRRAASPWGGFIRGFSAFRAGSRAVGHPGTMGESERRKLFCRLEGQENANRLT